ncbi:unnamed protein product, partial [Tilletia laevis]
MVDPWLIAWEEPHALLERPALAGIPPPGAGDQDDIKGAATVEEVIRVIMRSGVALVVCARPIVSSSALVVCARPIIALAIVVCACHYSSCSRTLAPVLALGLMQIKSKM